jgi:CRP/FNR family cyclic AMP-dependent transcriptional regulator
MTVSEALEAHPFTDDLTPEQIGTLAECVDAEVEWEPGAVIFNEGEVADRCYLLVDGSVAVGVESPGPGGPRTIHTVHAGDVLGWSWLFPPHRWVFGAVALTPTSAIALDGARLRGAVLDDPSFGVGLVMRVGALVAERLHATRLQLLDLYGNRG